MQPSRALVCLAIPLVLIASAARAVTVDGILDPEYGSALSTQSTQTSLGEPIGSSFGSELDQAFGFVADGTLHLLLAGGFNQWISELITPPNQLQLYVDVGPGGQGPLGGANPSVGFMTNLRHMTGLGFDADFAPDFWLAADRESFGRLHAFYAELPAGGGGAGYWLGSSAYGGPGTLSGVGASNPHGILASIDISTVAGVTAGCDAASGAGVTTGIEWAIPLAAIGNPTGQIRVCALIAAAWPTSGTVSNQLLGPAPPGTCSLGPASGVDLANVPGAQYFVVDVPTPVARTSWGRLKRAYR